MCVVSLQCSQYSKELLNTLLAAYSPYWFASPYLELANKNTILKVIPIC